MKPTVERRREIYAEVYDLIREDNKRGICSIIDDIYPNTNTLKNFPELKSLIPDKRTFYAQFWWYPFNTEGNAKRRMALLKAIDLTFNNNDKTRRIKSGKLD